MLPNDPTPTSVIHPVDPPPHYVILEWPLITFPLPCGKQQPPLLLTIGCLGCFTSLGGAQVWPEKERKRRESERFEGTENAAGQRGC